VELNEISGEIIAAALKVHTVIGPGVLESVYQTCLLHELQQRGVNVASQVALPVHYDNLKLDSGYRIDLLVEIELSLSLNV
jgi:GxxExxY protein